MAGNEKLDIVRYRLRIDGVAGLHGGKLIDSIMIFQRGFHLISQIRAFQCFDEYRK